jgi:hypothetical protein
MAKMEVDLSAIPEGGVCARLSGCVLLFLVYVALARELNCPSGWQAKT